MKKELFIQGNPVVLGVSLLNTETNKYEPVPFVNNGVTKVDVYLGDRNITDEQATVDFANDLGKLTIHKNNLVIVAGEYEVTVRITDSQHATPGQAVIHPAAGNHNKVIFVVV